MKYGAHIFLWLDRYGDDELAAILDRAVGLGLSFLEISIGDDVHFDHELLGRRAASLGMELILGPGGLWPMNCDISLESAEDRKAGIAWHKTAIDRCAACGAIAYAGGIYGHPGRIGPRPPSQAEKLRIAEGLHGVAAYGQERGVRLVVEPMSHYRTHIANTPCQINELIRMADHPNLFSLLDTYHLTREVSSFADAVAEMAPHLWYVHACENNRGAPGTGLLPWDEIAGALIRHQWDGHVGFESYNSRRADGEFAFSRGMFHDVCPDGDAYVRTAKAFLESRFEALR